MPKKRSPHSLRTSSVQAIGIVIQNACKTLVNKNSESENDVIPYIQDMVTNLPFQLVDDVFQEVSTQLSHLFYRLGLKDTFMDFDDIIKIICDSRVRYLSFEDLTKVFQYKLVDNLHCMTGIQILNLDRLSWKFKTSIALSVTQMKNLTRFHHHQYCTDEVVKALAHNCKSLQSLDVFRSERVSDASMMELGVCEALRYLNLEYTAVSSYGCAAVLRSVPGLKTLVYLEFSDVVEKLQGSTQMNIEVLEGLVSFSVLSLMKGLFPSLQEFTLDLSLGELNHDVVPVFKKLRALKIINGHFYNSYITKILDSNGVFLTRLVLYGIEFSGVDVIKTLATKCSLALTELELQYCSNSEQPTPIMNNFLNIDKFKNLNTLKIRHCRINIEDVLALSPDLTILTLYYVPNVTEDLIVNIINKHPLKHLKEFHINISNITNIGVAFVYNMLRCLGNLQRFKLGSHFTENELRDLRLYLKNEEMNVYIFTYYGQEV